MTRLCIAIGLLSLALLAFQLHLMQILSIVQWHHCGSMVVSVALLGFGAGGTALALFREGKINQPVLGKARRSRDIEQPALPARDY